MQHDEVRDAGALLGTALDEVAVVVRDVHQAVAKRIFGLLGPRTAPVRALHDGISNVVYASTRFGVRAAPAVVGATAAELRAPASASVHGTPRGHFVVNVLNGFWGDRLAQTRASLAPLLSLRTHEGELRRLPENLLHDLGATASGNIVVFVHGLCESDRYWTFRSEKQYGDRSVTYGSRLRDEQGWTPLYVNYNSGLHVSDNGKQLAEQLETIVACWPVPVESIALIGHSMGGLVARSASRQAVALGHGWTTSLRHIVGLGAPHHGAPLERFVNGGTHAMSRLPETRPFADWLNRRSVGIKDLRYGAIVDDDWWGVDPDERLVDRRTAAALLDGVTYSVVSATLSRRSDGPFAHDLLVQHRSAHGIHPTMTIVFDADHTMHVGHRTHFHLLNDLRIAEQLQLWLATESATAVAN
ncbi:MAG: alpha/beta hydrolase [Jatrophihabitantaceae bacterium]